MAENWSVESVESLIIEVRRYPWLWDSSRDDYRKLNKKNTSWKSISLSVGKPAKECQEKWRTLRNTYRKILHREKKLPSGSGGRNFKKWIYMSHLDFLRTSQEKRIEKTTNFQIQNIEMADEPFENGYISSTVLKPVITVQDSPTNITPIQTPHTIPTNKMNHNENDESIPVFAQSAAFTIANRVTEATAADNNNSDGTELSSLELSNPTSSSSSISKNKNSKTISNSFTKILESLQHRIESQMRDDEEYHFGQIVASKLRRIPQTVRHHTENTILQILNDSRICQE